MAPRQQRPLLRGLAALLRRGERRQVLRLALPGEVQLLGLPWGILMAYPWDKGWFLCPNEKITQLVGIDLQQIVEGYVQNPPNKNIYQPLGDVWEIHWRWKNDVCLI